MTTEQKTHSRGGNPADNPKDPVLIVHVEKPLREEFKAVCIMRGRTMREEIARFMRTEIARFKRGRK